MPRATRAKGQAAVEQTARALERLHVEYIPLRDLSPNTYNPNVQSDHDFELLCRSILEDGFTQPIVAARITTEFKQDKAFRVFKLGDQVITDGEHRWTALICTEHVKRQEAKPLALSADAWRQYRERRLDWLPEVGDIEIPTVFTPMTPAQMRVATLRHNRARGSEDYDLTAALLRDLESLGALDWAQDALLMDDVEIQALLENVPAPDALAGGEYGEAWAPGEREDAGEDGHMSAAAVEEMREAERKAALAHTEEERIAARRDADIFRLSLIFTGDEARIVKAVLGERPAERVLDLCRQAATVPA
jgi:hypothetical protein